MKSLWDNQEASAFEDDPLQLRVYTSRLLGRETSLVLHGGGNTSVKATSRNLFGEEIDVLYVKGSGWDLATIELAGFAPVRLDVLRQMAKLTHLSDKEMVREQRAAMLDPSAPTPSVETILHAIIPFKYVDHTHADSVVTISNTPNGAERIREIYGKSVLVVPYVMPGFILARTIADITKGIDWKQYEGMILLNHGLFSFADNARSSYEKMIRLVSKAEDYLSGYAPLKRKQATPEENLIELARLRRAVSNIWNEPVIAKLDNGSEAATFSNLKNAADIATRGTLTPDHVIRTKPWPVVIKTDVESDVKAYATNYRNYFIRNTDGNLNCLDAAPRWAIWPCHGCVSFGRSMDEANIISDIKDHTLSAITQAETMGKWNPVSEKSLFEIEYWELEQAKLKKDKPAPVLQGKVALVTGAASGIGKACALVLHAQGAAVLALDINPEIRNQFNETDLTGIACDVTDDKALKSAVDETIQKFGGLDIVISNAGIFPASEVIANMNTATWEASLDVNLSSHQRLLQHCAPYLELGIDPAIIIIASKNVPAPGPGAAAYSVAKAGLTQLGRVAALEMAEKSIRVNILHPNAVFDTGIWTDEVLEKRAAHYGLSIEEYKTNNLLKVEVSSHDVAEMAAAMAGPLFGKTTGAQLPVDGGNDRVI